MARTNQIQFRRGTATQWSTTNPVLASGEPGFDTTNNLFRLGDGTTAWNNLINVGSNLYSTTRGSEIVTANKSAFTVTGGYVSGNLDVYWNGLKFLRNDDFTETSSTIFTLTNPAVSGDIVEWVGLVGPATYQISDAGLTSIAGLTTASGSYIYATASDVYTTGVITSFGRSLVDDADASAGRTTLGLVIGTNVQAYDAGLQSIAGLTTGSGNYLYATASDVYTTGVITSFGRSLVDDADASAGRTTLGLAIGTDVQAYNANLADFIALVHSYGGFLISDGNHWVIHTPSSARVQLSLTVGIDVQAYDAGLTSIAGLTTAADRYIYTSANDVYTTGAITTFGRSLVDDADASTARTTLGLAIGTNVQAYDAGLTSIAALTTASGNYLYATANDVYTTGTSTVYGRSVLAASGVESLVTTTLTAGTGIALSYNSGTDTVTINTTFSTSRGSETVTTNKSAFTVAAEYVSGNLDVYYNGLKFLRNDDFTETSSTVFTLTNPAVSGDVVEWVGLVGPATYQISDAGLTSIASLTTASGSYLYATANDVYTTGAITTFGRSLVDDSTAAAARSTLEIGKVASTLAGGRLTLQTAVGVPASDQTAKTTIYYTPFAHGMIGLYDGTNWIPREFTERSLALGTLVSGKNYDVFAVSISDVISIEALVWTSDSARATALIAVDGVLCKTGDTTRRYVGTFRTTATTTTEDSEAKRFVYNAYNKVPRSMLGTLGYVDDSTANTFTFLSTLNTFAPINGGTGNKCEFVNGLTETVFLSATTFYTAGASTSLIVGIGLDTTTGVDFIVAQNETGGANTYSRGNSKSIQFAAGYHYGSLNGATTDVSTAGTFYRDQARFGSASDPRRTFIAGSINS